uniref:Ig-like domain-containing protein n=1 Tax=Caenorhabditis japonica TaxID=281687 RepID=A0A8R1E4Y0_CAEJA
MAHCVALLFLTTTLLQATVIGHALEVLDGNSNTTTQWLAGELKPTITWEEMEVSAEGERRFFCGEFDSSFTGRYHWRFNGSSILPERTQIHRNQFVFLSGANAIRNQLDGEYECCVRETLGNACYSRMIAVKNKTDQHNIDMTNSTLLLGEEGHTYYIRVHDVKRVEGVKCTLDGVNVDNFKYPHFGRQTKRTVPYHLKIENLEKGGEVKCDLRLQRKEIIEKTFDVRLLGTFSSSSSSNIFILILSFVTLILGFTI